MPGINGTLEMARRALMTQQAALGVTGENIANINTPGYARRRVQLMQGPTLTTPEGSFGSGAVITSISSIRDPFIERQVRRAMGDSGRYDQANQQLQMIEQVVGAMDETSLTATMDRFWNSWQDLSADPTSQGARTIVREAAQGLVNKFQSLHANLKNQETEINRQIVDKIAEVNSLTRQLAKLNGEKVGTVNAGEIDDDRSQLLDKLAKLTGATYSQTQDGSVTLTLNGVAIVDGGNAREFKYEIDGQGRPIMLPFTEGGVTPRVTTGEIAGLESARDNDLVSLEEGLDRIAVTIAEEVNRIHSTGTDANGDTAFSFFADGISGAGDFRISNLILNDSSRISASMDTGSGDNSIALAIAELQLAPLIDGETIGEAYRTTVTELSTSIRENEFLSQASANALVQMEDYRSSVSGVSIDEEMSNLLKYENSYNAAAKLVQVVSKMLDTLLTLS